MKRCLLVSGLDSSVLMLGTSAAIRPSTSASYTLSQPRVVREELRSDGLESDATRSKPRSGDHQGQLCSFVFLS
jgi:hypothetical protein